MKTRLLKNALIGLALVTMQSKFANAQESFHCGTDAMMKKLYQEHPEMLQAQKDYDKKMAEEVEAKSKLKSPAAEAVYIIPVVFHVIHTYGSENISDAQILDQVAILNKDYRKLNADTAGIVPQFQGLAADSKIEFRLAKLDPNGNCTNGIDRIYSHKTNSADDMSKLNPWPKNKYLNVWVVKTIGSAGVAGYAYYPSATTGWLTAFDGILILHNYIGSIGTSTPGTSRALTHEIGHWLNLSHTWGSTNDPAVACGDDLVNDTPITKGHNNCANRFDYTCDSQNMTAATYNFANVTTSSGTTDPTTPPNQYNTVSALAVQLSNFAATGVSANSAVAGSFGFTGWDNGATNGETVYANLTGAINTGKYYEFTVTPIFGQGMTITGITFNVKRDTNGVRTFAVRSSVGGYATNLAASITPANALLSVQAGNTFFINTDTTVSLAGSKITLTGASFTNIYSPVTFRIYGFNAEDTDGTFEIDNVNITGTFGTIENVENYMEYSYCSKMYTYDQKTRMRTALESSVSGRNNLWINANLAATGVLPVAADCKAKPDFYVQSDRRMVCAGSTVTFMKNILNGTPTSLLWRFPGSNTPTSTSMAASVNVVYPNPGVYPVTLVATNAAGADSVVKTDYITVSNPWGDYMGNGYTENFENASSFWYNWRINNPDNNFNTFTHVTYAGYNSSSSILMNSFQNYANDVDELISPSFNLAYVTPATLSFKYAGSSHGTTAADIKDALKVYFSTNCGNTWTILGGGTINNAALANNGYSAGFFTPTNASQWVSKTLTLPSAANHQNVRFKFEYTSGPEPNNVYIDDININGVVGISENANSFDLLIAPNPANQSTTISYHLTQKADVKMEVVDVLGKVIALPVNTAQSEGDYRVTLSRYDNRLTNGVYFIKLTVGNTTVTRKLIITE
jgi:PKD repeat protein